MFFIWVEIGSDINNPENNTFLADQSENVFYSRSTFIQQMEKKNQDPGRQEGGAKKDSVKKRIFKRQWNFLVLQFDKDLWRSSHEKQSDDEE